MLFEAVRAHQQDPGVICVVYTGDIAPLPGGVPKSEILAKAQERFGITLRAEAVAFLPLRNQYLLGEKYWSHFTLLGQAYGGNRVGYEALGQLVPDVFIDTMGCAFALPPVKLFSQQVRVGAYIHYPTISTDMLQRVRRRRAGHTNAAWVASSWPLTMLKLLYYHLFAAAYGSALRAADAIAVNGSWTREHIEALLPPRLPTVRTPVLPPVHVVYPPCDTERFCDLPLDERQPRSIVSLAQFRPEKEHETQLRIVHELVTRYPALKSAQGKTRPLKLTLIGSCRNDDDRARVAELQALAKRLTIEAHLEWCIDAPWALVHQKLRTASIGLSTMVDEHFGISVVETMAAGLIPLTHASAGPLLDIVVPVDGEPTGFHAKDVDEFVACAEKLVTMPQADARVLRARARAHAQATFSNAHFVHAWRTELWDRLVPRALLEANQRRIERAAAPSADAAAAPAAAA